MSDDIRRKLFFQGKVFTVVDAIVNIHFMMDACLNGRMRNSNL